MNDRQQTLDDPRDGAPEADAPKRGRPPGARSKRVRRNFAGELTDLQARVDMAVRLLKRCQPADGLVAVAIETLEGKP